MSTPRLLKKRREHHCYLLYDYVCFHRQSFFFWGGGRLYKRQNIYLGNNSLKIISCTQNPGARISMGQNIHPQQTSVVVLVTQSCPTLCDPMDHSLPGSSVHGVSQARVLGCHFLVQGIFLPRDQTPVSYIVRQILYHRQTLGKESLKQKQKQTKKMSQ